jgi:hypothetical protein
VILSLAGRELGIKQLLPAEEREIDDRDTSLSRLLAITLLPFLGMYAAFGQVAEAAQRLVTQQWVRYGFLSDQQTVLGALHDLASQHLLWLIALLVGIYVLRRLLDFVAERARLRILDLVVVLIESFFMLLLMSAASGHSRGSRSGWKTGRSCSGSRKSKTRWPASSRSSRSTCPKS